MLYIFSNDVSSAEYKADKENIQPNLSHIHSPIRAPQQAYSSEE
jgi:hypothetical protein